MEAHKPRRALRVLPAAAGAGPRRSQARAEGTPSFDAYYSNHPKEWFDAVSEMDYFNPSLTRSWQLNETCNDAGALSVASYNIFHNVPFVTDFGDEMEQSLGEGDQVRRHPPVPGGLGLRRHHPGWPQGGPGRARLQHADPLRLVLR